MCPPALGDTMDHQQTWAAKLAASSGVDVRPVPEGRKNMTPGKTMLYPSAQMVNDAVRAISEGQSVTPNELRTELARRYNADHTCPVTITMMLRIVAEAANEAHRGGAAPHVIGAGDTEPAGHEQSSR